MYTVASDASFAFSPDSFFVSHTGIYELIITVFSRKTPANTESTSFKINITVLDPVDCIPNLTLPTLPFSSMIYKLGGHASLLLNNGTENGNCGFDMLFLDSQTSSALSSDIFTVTNTTFTNEIPAWWHYRTIATYPSISLHTTDITYAYQTYHLKIEMVDHLMGASSTISLPLDIQIWDNPCDGTW